MDINPEIENPISSKPTPEKNTHPSALDLRKLRVEDRTENRITPFGKRVGNARVNFIDWRIGNLNECLR